MLNYIENLKEEIIKNTQELIRIPSVGSTSNNINMPFGENANKALEYVLNLGKNLGFKVKNLDGYCGYIEFGEGEELLGIIGHLDVVPEVGQFHLLVQQFMTIKYLVEEPLMIKDLLLVLYML